MEVKNKKLDSNNTATFKPRPQSFVALMDMYEANYIRLRLFCGDIRQLPDESISMVANGVPVQLKVKLMLSVVIVEFQAETCVYGKESLIAC